MKTLFNTIKPIFSERVLKIFHNEKSYQELLTAIKAEREGIPVSENIVHLNGKKLKLIRVR